MSKELGQGYFDSFIELKRFVERMEGVIVEVINIEQTATGKFAIYYWARKEG